MAKQEIICTCIPRGRGPGRVVKFSLLLSPRLSGPNKLEPYVFNAWPEKAEKMFLKGFDVLFGKKKATFVGAEIDFVGREDLWAILFPSDTFVRSFEVESMENKKISSFPVQKVVDYTQQKMTEVAVLAPQKALDANVLAKQKFFGEIALPATIDGKKLGGETAQQNQSELKKQLHKSETKKLNIEALGNKKPDPPLDFYQAADFYNKANQKRLETKVPGAGGPDKRLDFHQMASLLGNYPQLQRLLAFVFDFEVEAPDGVHFIRTLPIRVVPKWDSDSGPSPTFVCPATIMDMNDCFAAPRPAKGDGDIDTPTRPQLVNGKLDLANRFGNGSRVFALTQVDADAAAFSMKRFADRVMKTLKTNEAYSRGVPGPPAKQADGDTPLVPPSLKSPGLSLSRAGRAMVLAQSLERTFKYNQQLLSKSFFSGAPAGAPAGGDQGKEKRKPDVNLYADDLVRGYAIDIFDESKGRWFTLTTREGEARFLGKSTVTEPILPEEGWISPAVTKPPPKSGLPQNELEIHETMFRWSNWSLATTRPGKTVTPNEEAQKVANTAETDFPLEVEYRVPTSPPTPPGGVLPILRYGRGYRARARVVDLAGNATPFGTPTVEDRAISTPIRFFDRLEPGPPPVLIMRNPRTPAESLEHMVIRSDAFDSDAGVVHCLRHVIAPKIDQFGAELHGMFDFESGLDGSLDTYEMIRAREKGSIDEKDGNGDFVHPNALPDPGNYGQPYYNVDQIQFEVENGDLANAPYLPDPLCERAAFNGLPGADNPNTPVSWPFYSGKPPWPFTQPLLLRLRAGNSPLDFTSNTLNVYLPKAQVVEASYSSAHESNDLTKLGLMRWIAEAAENPETDGSDDQHERERYKFVQWLNLQARSHGYVASGARPSTMQFMQKVAKDSRNPRWWKTASAELKHVAQIAGGTHMMVMPSRKLMLVHAVRRPLEEPSFSSLNCDRSVESNTYLYGRTYAKLADEGIFYDRPSTGMIEVRASWMDVRDQFEPDGGGKGGTEWAPRGELHKNEVVHRYDPGKPGTDEPLMKFRHEFHDTKYRGVQYNIVVTTRFKEYFTDNETVNWVTGNEEIVLPPSPELLGQPGVVPESEKVFVPADERQAHPELGSTYVKDVHYEMDYDNGTISRIFSATPPIPTGKDIRVEYISPPVTRFSGKGGAFREILNTARPDAPNIKFIIPTFKWSSSYDYPSIGSSREARTLRVWLERPWWSSGDGELLGVLLQNSNARLKKDSQYVTRWALDPISRSKASKDVAKAEHFPLAVDSRKGLNLEELPSYSKVAVAGHEVNYDYDRQLWFCDIRVDTDSYFPFIRLALARYQPNSIDGAHLSRVVTANFIQLAPDRAVSIALESKGTIANVNLTGRAYSQVETRFGPPRIEVTVERRRQMSGMPDDEELGWEYFSGPTYLEVSNISDSNLYTWSGNVQLPGDINTVRYRLVIKEYEILYTGRTLLFGTKIRRPRLVYADAIELDPLNP